MRTIIDIPEPQVRELAEICRREGLSRAEAVRRAVQAYVAEHGPTPDDAVFGLWRERARDGLEFERSMRGEWS